MRLVESVLEFCMRGVAFVDSVVTLVVSKWEQRKEFAWVLDYAKVCVGIVVEFLFYSQFDRKLKPCMEE